jgi:hypothetical protein
MVLLEDKMNIWFRMNGRLKVIQNVSSQELQDLMLGFERENYYFLQEGKKVNILDIDPSGVIEIVYRLRGGSRSRIGLEVMNMLYLGRVIGARETSPAMELMLEEFDYLIENFHDQDLLDDYADLNMLFKDKLSTLGYAPFNFDLSKISTVLFYDKSYWLITSHVFYMTIGSILVLKDVLVKHPFSKARAFAQMARDMLTMVIDNEDLNDLIKEWEDPLKDLNGFISNFEKSLS